MITAPWTDDQVMQLNRYQTGEYMHPFTCPSEMHEAVLIGSRDNWECPYPECDYTQTWAHDFMVNKGWMDEVDAYRRRSRIGDLNFTRPPEGQTT